MFVDPVGTGLSRPVGKGKLEAAVRPLRPRVVVVEENARGLYAREIADVLGDVEVRRVNGIGAMIPPARVREAIEA